jgi:hypothetical protein
MRGARVQAGLTAAAAEDTATLRTAKNMIKAFIMNLGKIVVWNY